MSRKAPACFAASVIGQADGGALIVTDTYASKPGGLSYCRAGRERFLRVLAVAGTTLRETLRLTLESCRGNAELAEDGVRWQRERALLTIHWLSPLEKSEAFRIASDGSVRNVLEK